MKEELNIAAILKEKPNGTKLWSDVFGKVEVGFVTQEGDFPINIIASNGCDVDLTKEGKYYEDVADCLPCIYPSRNMRDWSKFAWKKGDVLRGNKGFKVLFDKWANDTYTGFYAKMCNLGFSCYCDTDKYTLAPENEAKSYIKIIEDKFKGKLNLVTLKIEKQPEFKDGDIVFMKGIEAKLYANCIFILKGEYKDGDERAFYYAFYNADDKFTEAEYGNTKVHYSLRPATDSEKQQLFDALEKEGKRWDAENKMVVDLKPKCEFKPFDRCIWKIRNCEGSIWQASFVSYVDKYGATPMGISIDEDLVNLIILPYNDQTKLLVGTTDEWKGGEQ